MPTHVAFLRAINVGGRRVKNDRLIQIATDAGLKNVSAYQAAGNLLFDSDGDPAPALRARLSSALGYDVPVFVRTKDEVMALIGAQPFPEADVSASKGKVQVTLLDAAPAPEIRLNVQELARGDDRIGFAEDPSIAAWYWLPEAGVGRSKLDMGAVEAMLGVGTTRTIGTLARIADTL